MAGADGLTSAFAFGADGSTGVTGGLKTGTPAGFAGADSFFTGVSISFLAGASTTGLAGGATTTLTGAGGSTFAFAAA